VLPFSSPFPLQAAPCRLHGSFSRASCRLSPPFSSVLLLGWFSLCILLMSFRFHYLPLPFCVTLSQQANALPTWTC
jgi:hypothetical protein